MIVVVLTTVTCVAAVPPSETVALGRKPVPAIEIEVPPDVVPVFAVTVETVGVAFAVEVNAESSEPL